VHVQNWSSSFALFIINSLFNYFYNSRHVLKELIETERVYVNELKLVIEVSLSNIRSIITFTYL
jgi:hypothetical protein